MKPVEQPIPREVLKGIDPNSVRTILNACQYEFLGEISSGRYRGRAVFESRDSSQLIVPMGQDAPDYVDVLTTIAEHLGERFNATAGSFLEQFVSPHTDKVQYQVADYPETKFGDIRLGALQNLTSGLYRVLKHSAQEVAKRFNTALRRSGLAHDFISQCRFSQTQYGSFVANILCPAVLDTFEHEGKQIPFGQQATMKAVDVFRTLKATELVPNQETVRDKAIYAAISDIDKELPSLGRAENHVWVRYSSFKASENEFFKSDEITFDRTLYTRAKDLMGKIARCEQTQRKEWTGFVIDLHLDSPAIDELNRDRHIELEVKAGSGRRLIKVAVDPESYKVAVSAQQQNLPVKLDAKVDTSRRNWATIELFNLRICGPVEPLLDTPVQ